MGSKMQPLIDAQSALDEAQITPDDMPEKTPTTIIETVDTATASGRIVLQCGDHKLAYVSWRACRNIKGDPALSEPATVFPTDSGVNSAIAHIGHWVEISEFFAEAAKRVAEHREIYTDPFRGITEEFNLSGRN